MNNVINSAERRGKEEGIQKEKIDTAHRLHAMGLTMEQIAQGGYHFLSSYHLLLPQQMSFESYVGSTSNK
jgi:hypothetical protein